MASWTPRVLRERRKRAAASVWSARACSVTSSLRRPGARPV